MLRAVKTFVSCSLPLAWLAMALRALESGEIGINPFDPPYLQDKLSVIDTVLSLVLEDSATNEVRCLAKIRKDASMRTRKTDMLILTYVK